jgi:DNA-binding MarR family transcriptional regulator
LSSSGEDQEKLLAAIECAANSTRHKILEILSETPGLGAKALADKMGVSRQHVAYHIGELKKVDLIKDMPAGTTVIYNITQLGRMALERIRSTAQPEGAPAHAIPSPSPIPPPPPQQQQAVKPAVPHGPSSTRLLGLMPALAGFILLLYSMFRAFIDKQPGYIVGGVVVFILLAYVSRRVMSWWP